jgi:NDP-sugar pyrophosphorylase family protein
LLTINSKTILEYVIDNFKQDDTQFYFIFQKKHVDQYGLELDAVLRKAGIDYRLIITDGLTDGAVNTAILAVPHIKKFDELIIANSDQWVAWDLNRFLKTMHTENADGAMPIFIDEKQENKWSFVAMDDTRRITEVRAKDAFTKFAVVGIYYFKQKDYFEYYANKMILANKRVNGEFYVCPVYNELIQDNKRVFAYKVDKMVGLGTPNDFEAAKSILI